MNKEKIYEKIKYELDLQLRILKNHEIHFEIYSKAYKKKISEPYDNAIERVDTINELLCSMNYHSNCIQHAKDEIDFYQSLYDLLIKTEK